LEWCFEKGRRPGEEEIEIWNSFILKRGWRDEASADLRAAKEREGFADRDDIQTCDWLSSYSGRYPSLSFRKTTPSGLVSSPDFSFF